VNNATDPPADDPRTGAGSQPPGDAAQRGLPASPRSDPAREPLSKFQRLSLTLNAIGLLISALGFTAVIVSIRTAQEQMGYMATQTRIATRDRSLSNVLTLHRVFLDQPGLRPYFFEGKDLEETDPLYPKVEAVTSTFSPTTWTTASSFPMITAARSPTRATSARGSP
jgi:hypothetical protein